MPIKIPDKLPARKTLEAENIFVMTDRRALHQDIRPLKLLLLNLMPTKIVTETQLLRRLSNTPLQVEVEFLQTASHVAKNTDENHMQAFYRTFDQVRHTRYDGMIITGAPVETLHFTQVDYWAELCQIMEWTKTHVHSTMHICWGAQAALYYHHQIEKKPLDGKLFGIFPHRVTCPTSPLFRGFDDVFFAPHSRHTTIDKGAVAKAENLRILAVSDKAGIYALKTEDNRQFFITGHPEYDADTLAKEYFRDKERGLDIAVPENYFPENNPANPPHVTWRAAAQLIYTNWLNYHVYQTTPYDLDTLDNQSQGAKP